jgi:YD repeat-containing protein
VDIRYEYDDRGRMTAHLDQMQEQYSWTAVYDDEARTMTCTYPHAVSVSYFDEHGNTIRQETVFENGDTSGIIFEFDANGNRISARYEETVGTTLHAYTYDDQGRVLTVTQTTAEGTERLFRYEYRDDCTIQYNYDGTRIVTTYNADGSEHYRYYTDSTDHITKDSMCYYTEIQVPIEEVSP